MSFDTIVLSGGGSKGIVFLGALHYYYDNHLISHSSISNYIGTSIGSVISLLLACGYTPSEIFSEINDIETFFTVKDLFSIRGAIEKWGISDISQTKIMAKIEEVVIKKLKINPTFQQLYELTGKNLIVCATNHTQGCAEYFSHVTHPKLHCMNAVKMSCCIPIIFKPLTYKGCQYIDGGVTDNFPIDYNLQYKALGIVVLNKTFNGGNDEENFISYVLKIMMFPIYTNTLQKCEKAKKHNQKIIVVEWKNISLITSVINETEKLEMFSRGYDQASYENTTINLPFDVECEVNKGLSEPLEWNDDF